MKNLAWMVAVVTLIPAGCGDIEQNQDSRHIDQEVLEAPAAITTDSLVNTQVEKLDETVVREVESVETAQEFADLPREPVAGALEDIQGDSGMSTDAVTGAIPEVVPRQKPVIRKTP